MNTRELHKAGFNVYSFATEACRAEFRRTLAEETDVEFEFKELDEELPTHHRLFFLAAKRTSLTPKQCLPNYPKGD